MPRGGKNNKNASLMGRVEKVCGRTIVQPIIGSTSGVSSISPATFPRCLAMADVFEFYRFTRLDIEVPPSSGVSYAIGYTNQGFDTPPTTIAGVIELPYAKYMADACTTFRQLNIGRKELLGDNNLKWFKTIPGTPATQFEIQGNIYAAIASSGGVDLIIEWECEFSQWNLAAQSPLYREPAFELVPGTDLYKKVTYRDARKGKATPSDDKSLIPAQVST